MTALIDVLWSVLTAAGGTLALGLIVTLAVGINALTLLFLGSAVVTLERFARASRRRGACSDSRCVWSLLVAAGVAAWGGPELTGAGVEPGWRAIRGRAARVAARGRARGGWAFARRSRASPPECSRAAAPACWASAMRWWSAPAAGSCTRPRRRWWRPARSRCSRCGGGRRR